MQARDGEPSWFVGRGWYVIMLVALIASGIVGGVISHVLGKPRATSQQAQMEKEVILPNAGLLFKSESGKLVAKLDASDDGGSLLLYNTNEKPTIIMTATQDGDGLIGLNSSGKGSVIQLAGNEEGGSVVLFSAKHGKSVLVLSGGDDGGGLEVNGPTGDSAVTIETRKSGRLVNGNIEVLESISGKSLWSVPGEKR